MGKKAMREKDVKICVYVYIYIHMLLREQE